MSGSAGPTGCLYSPFAGVTPKGAVDFWGALVGNDLDIGGGAQVHYDQVAAILAYLPGNKFLASRWRLQ